ncbi:Tyrosine recombinase XerC [Paraburkholderia domus]|uniref:tyrosine-type recombinase/integrase n=1 Tax=Paraburkholderia domus TaxID=2793075 RepID=UPI001913163E|nr:site-specific integrase [Paraburkholderia domus]MBK5051698.1 site-specific integrase [Burkholderia sp. R-70006]CAE6795738.1 Tyrosine recombinase XerC [Paraburkholderia domus]
MASHSIIRAAVLAPGQIRHLLAVTEATSRHPERDAVILLLGLSCGMRITEIAQITVADVCFPSGKLRHEVSLRAAITKGCRQRCIFLSGHKLAVAIERYLGYRVAKGLGTTVARPEYRGLIADLPLILTRKGYPYSLNIKLRLSDTGAVLTYWAADTLQSYVTHLYRAAGLSGTSHSGRRTFATRLLAKGASIEDVQLLLGHQGIDQTMRYMDVNPKELQRALNSVI